MIRRASPGDEAAMDAFLANHAATSMFLRSNLADYGLEGSDADNATTYWLAGDPVCEVYGIANTGFVMGHGTSQGWSDFAAALQGRDVAGITGDAPQVAMARAAFGITDMMCQLEDVEPLYRLDLSDLSLRGLPEGTLRRPTHADHDLLVQWHFAYACETLTDRQDTRMDNARARAARSISEPVTWIFEIQNRPVAMTSLNAQLDDMVQIGGVYAPPDERGKRYARAAVARQLHEAAGQGKKTAILFASGPAAQRSYEGIGFQRVGEYGLCILRAPMLVENTS